MRACEHRGLHWFAVLTAAATLGLIGIGGVVTSKGVGLSVPDWPTTYGYNMFFFPVSKWVGGVFYEHSHRLAASGVGLMTTILAVWLWLKEPRRWLRWLGVAAFIGVVLQGVLGGLRVTELMDELGIVHAALAQLFFVLVSAIALFTSRWWQTAASAAGARPGGAGLRPWYAAATVLVFLQLLLGAGMRHEHAGLAVPDFPLAYGKWWPDMDAASVERYNQLRHEAVALNPITAGGIALHMAHRAGAVLVLGTILMAAWKTRRHLERRHPLRRIAHGWTILVAVQAGLGAATVWSNKSADIATLHVTVGALVLVAGAMLVLMHYRLFAPASAAVRKEVREPGLGGMEGDASGVPV